MKNFKAISLFLVCLLLIPAAAFAETVTQEDTGSEAPVIFYEHTVGRGISFEPAVPSAGAAISDVDNLISNVFIGRDDIVVTLYEDPDFGGRSIVLEGAGLHNLVSLDFNDMASSFEVAWKEGAAPVTFFEHVDATGWAHAAEYMASAAVLDESLNDQMSAVLINDPNIAVVLYEHIDFGGNSLVLDTVGLHDLEALGFNDIVSSFEIRAK